MALPFQLERSIIRNPSGSPLATKIRMENGWMLFIVCIFVLRGIVFPAGWFVRDGHLNKTSRK